MPRPRAFNNFPASLRCEYGPYMAVLDSWTDGDTCKVLCDPGFDETPCRWLRLKDVRAPELWQEGGPETRDFAASLVPEGTPLRVTTTKTPVSGNQKTSLSRYEATLETSSGVDVAAEINRFVAENGYPTGY